jgi:molecular chaperone DnaK
MDVLRIINEPTAGLFGLRSGQEASKVVAVYDLGGGTFDISILEMMEGVFEVKATNGDTSCGGEDVDGIIQTWIINEFRQQSGINVA